MKQKNKKSLVPGVMRSLRKARKVTSEFHIVTAALESAKMAGKLSEVAKLTSELERLGGREAYQEASVLATSRSKHSSKWVFSELTKLGLRPHKGESPLRLLEVGAVNTQLLSIPWLSVGILAGTPQSALRLHVASTLSRQARHCQLLGAFPNSARCVLSTSAAVIDA
mmetsp:Transcript_18220/g.51040  ORF Transcript_18220/g.51040 Transcript_18220/m.51040 type:complete len:168 (-) Transcript_18220:2771-3274(-)